MNAIDRLIPLPRLLERDSADLAAEPARVWELVRHLDMARVPIVRGLFALRTLPSRIAGTAPNIPSLSIDDLCSTPEHPGFQLLDEDAPRELTVGAIGKVWRPDIPFLHVSSGTEFSACEEPDEVKVAWSLRVEPLGARDTRLFFELRVAATDGAAWRKFRAYFALVGPGSRFIRHSLLHALERELGVPDGMERNRAMAGDFLLPDASGQLTHGITIDASPSEIWPWLVQMGGHRAGFYSYDVLDNGGVRSARELHSELRDVRVGDVLPATREGPNGFEVLHVERDRSLVLGGLTDVETGAQLPFSAPRPASFWQSTWAFELEPLDGRSTRLRARARAAMSTSQRARGWLIPPVHELMERAQLRHLKARVEKTLPASDLRDVLSGIGGALAMGLAIATPFLRDSRSHWGVGADEAARVWPGDERITEPSWTFTHAVEIQTSAVDVWPWIAQIGADRAGFYSHQWLENLAGCQLHNAESIHAEWSARVGDALVLSPKSPPMTIVQVEPGRLLLAQGAPDERAKQGGEPWMEATWLLLVEPRGTESCRLVSRFRVRHSEDLATRLAAGPTVLEPVGFVMDREMLLGVKRRAEERSREVTFGPR